MTKLLMIGFVIALSTLSATAGKNLANGVACKFQSDCESGNCSNKVCKAKSGFGGGEKIGNGVACRFQSDCESGVCSNKVCKASSSSKKKKAANGEKCKVSSDCASGHCRSRVCKK